MVNLVSKTGLTRYIKKLLDFNRERFRV